MSTEQSESAPAVTAPQVETKAAPAADVTQQATTPTATTQRVKNPKRVAAGKMVAERTRLAREEQKKAAESYHAEKEAKAATAAAPEPAQTTEGESAKSENPNSGWPSINQWINIGGIVVSLFWIYYKWEDIKAMTKTASDKFKKPEPAPEPASAEPEPARATHRKGLRNMI